jgi:hypothetical protein
MGCCLYRCLQFLPHLASDLTALLGVRLFTGSAIALLREGPLPQCRRQVGASSSLPLVQSQYRAREFAEFKGGF